MNSGKQATRRCYAVFTRNIVVFYFNGTINELANIVTDSFVANPSYKVIDFLSDKTNTFSFTIGWPHFWHGVLLSCTRMEDGVFKIVFSHSTPQRFVPTYAEELHKILRDRVIASNISWYENEIITGNGNGMPW